MSRRITYAAAWVVCAVVAIVVGVAAVSTIGASVRGRGPLGDAPPVEERGQSQVVVSPDPDAEVVADTIAGEFGELDVECRGAVAYALDARPDEAVGWRVVSFEPGPDDDVDAVFGNRARSIEFEVFCNRGRPTLSDFEENTLPDD